MRIKKNVGDVDRVLRVLIGIGLLLVAPLGLIGPRASWTLFGPAGLALLLTGVFGVCITYKLLGISTAKRRAAKEMAD
jgi:hypothetical protein